jgi:glucokinase
MEKETVIGVEIDGINARIGRIQNDAIEQYDSITISFNESADYVMNQIIELIERVFNSDVVGIGIGVPTIIDIEKGIAYNVQNIPSWKEVHVKEILENRFKVDVHVNNDANCFTVGEKYFGKGSSYRNIAGLIIGTGVGAGVIIDNKLYSGANGGAGEFGKLPYKDATIEHYCSEKFFTRMYNTSFKDTFLDAKKGNQKALEIYKELGVNLGDAVISILQTLDPSCIVLGGSVSRAFSFFSDAMWEQIKTYQYGNTVDRLVIDVSNAPKIAVLGAAALYYDAQEGMDLEEAKNKRKQAEAALVIERNLLKAAKRETDNILQSVDEGLFLLDSQYDIKSQHSQVLESIFEDSNLSQRNFFELLETLITAGEIKTIKSYLEMMFKEDYEDHVLEELNPLTNIEMKFKRNGEKKSVKKYLAFKLKRIQDDDEKIAELMVAVRDITEQVILSNKLKQSEIESKRQIEWLLSILHIEPQILLEFIENVEVDLNEIKQLLEKYRQKESTEILKNVSRTMHLIKGNAGLLELNVIADMAHEFEDTLVRLKQKPKIKEQDYNKLLTIISEMLNGFSEINRLLGKIENFHKNFRPKRKYENTQLINSLENMIKQLARDKDFQIIFDHKSFNCQDMPYQYKLLIKESLVQFIRNSVSHGFEPMGERKKTGKPEAGTIELSSSLNDDFFEFTYKDDGRGISLVNLKSKLEKSGLKKAAEIKNWSNEQILKSIFISGLTTSEGVDKLSGRGVGLDAIKHKVESSGGKIEVQSEYGKFCSFHVAIPLTGD